MIGIGIVTHSDIAIIDRSGSSETPDIFDIVKTLIRTIIDFTKQEFFLVIRDNCSFDYRFTKAVFLKGIDKSNILFYRSNVNDLTDAWNEIIRICLNDKGCDGVILLNQDVIVESNWENLVKAVSLQKRDLVAPMSNGATYQILQYVPQKKFEEKDEIIQVPAVQGFCFGCSRKAFESNMFDSTNYFDPQVEWDYNEEEWQIRNNASGGRTLILKNCFVIHYDMHVWLENGLKSTKRVNYMNRNEKHIVLNSFKYTDYIRG